LKNVNSLINALSVTCAYYSSSVPCLADFVLEYDVFVTSAPNTCTYLYLHIWILHIHTLQWADLYRILILNHKNLA